MKVKIIFFLWFSLFSSIIWAGRDIAIIIDTSGSMASSDKPRYTVQLSKIIADLIKPKDALSVVRFPQSESCYDADDLSLATTVDTSNRGTSKQRIDEVIGYGGGNAFNRPIRTAVKLLRKNPENDRLLLIIADSGGISDCKTKLNRELLALHDSHATLAAINIGTDAGSFEQNPAFNFTASAADAYKLIDATAQIYQQFLGYKSVQKGQVSNEIVVTIAPYVQSAFLVVAADGAFDAIHPVDPQLKARKIDINFATGVTQGLDGISRTYRIIALTDPEEGLWRFKVDNLQAKAGWMLLQDSAIGLRVVSRELPKSVDVPMEVEVIDKRTGLVVKDPRILKDIKTSLKLGDKDIPLYDDGTHGDAKAGDGKMTAIVKFDDDNGDISIQLDNQELSKIKHQTIKLVDGHWLINIKTPLTTTIEQPILLSVQLKSIGNISGLKIPSYISVSGAGYILKLNDQGKNGDKIAKDKIYSATYTPNKTGILDLTYFAGISAFVKKPEKQHLNIFSIFDFKNIKPIIFTGAKSRTEQQHPLILEKAIIQGDLKAALSHDYKARKSALEININRQWLSFDKTINVRFSENNRPDWQLRLKVACCPEKVLLTDSFNIQLKIEGTKEAQIYKIPLHIEVIPDPWLECWWRELAFVITTLVTLIYIHGILVSSKFSPYLALVIATDEEDLEDGLTTNISRTKGAVRHFHRDVRVYLHYDYRLKNQSKGAILRLRAKQGLTLLLPMHGHVIERLNSSMEWEACPEKEISMTQNTTYKNSSGNLFFKLVIKKV